MITKKQILKVINESVNTDIYHDTFSSAVQFARAEVEKRGVEIDEDDWWREITTGPGRPKDGETFRATIGLYKNGKLLRKALHIQVYNRGLQFKNNYELNYYIS